MTLAAIAKLDAIFSVRDGDYAAFSGIGSRETPVDVCRDMTNISAEAFRRGFTLRSGGAGGADLACEKDVPESGKEIFLPWKGFNGSTSRFYPAPVSDAAIAAAAARLAPQFDPSRILDFDGSNADPADIAGRSLLIARHFHPAWDRCRPGAQKLHMRNVPQGARSDAVQPGSFRSLLDKGRRRNWRYRTSDPYRGGHRRSGAESPAQPRAAVAAVVSRPMKRKSRPAGPARFFCFQGYAAALVRRPPGFLPRPIFFANADRSAA